MPKCFADASPLFFDDGRGVKNLSSIPEIRTNIVKGIY